MSVERKFWSTRLEQPPHTIIIVVQRAVLLMTQPMKSASANVLPTLRQRSLAAIKSVILRAIVMKAILVTRLVRQAVQLRALKAIPAQVARALAQHQDMHLKAAYAQTVIA